MAKEEVKEAVVEEPVEVVEKPAAVVKEPTAVVEEPVDTGENEEELSPWYVFCSTGCGFCKKAEPVVEELNNEGYDILTLDVAEPDNAKLRDELFAEYKTQCGTPWFINADTGKGICGFREKGILKKWLDGEDIPVPPRPTGPPPKVPFYGSTDKENAGWTKTYDKWLKDNKHMDDEWLSKQRTAKVIIDGPRPKSDPPQVPPIQTATDQQIDEWGEKLKVWQEENNQLPNLQPVDTITQNFKNRRNQIQSQQQQGGAPGAPAAGGVVDNTKLNSMDARVQALEVKIDKLMSHFGVK